jgi:integrase/recombinase XerD
MYSVSSVIKSKKLNDGSFAVYLRLTISSKVSYLATGIRVDKKNWDKKLGRLKNHAPLSMESNNFLEDRKNALKKLLLNEGNLSKSPKAILEMCRPRSVDFFVYVDLFLKVRENRGQAETVDTYSDYVNQLRKYKKEIYLADIDEEWVNGYVRFLRVSNNDATVSRKLKFLRGVMDIAVKAGVVSENAFNLVAVKPSKPKIKEIPTSGEISKLIESLPTLVGRQRLYVQVFLVQFFTRGTRISDILLLKRASIVGDTIQILEQKNKSYKSIGLHDYVKMWAEEWKHPVYMFPVINWTPSDKLSEKENRIAKKKAVSSGTTLVNKALRLVCKKIGIEKKLTTHSSRHGFTTMAINKLQGDLRKVQGLVNHANFKTTENYAHDLNATNYAEEEKIIYKNL